MEHKIKDLELTIHDLKYQREDLLGKNESKTKQVEDLQKQLDLLKNANLSSENKILKLRLAEESAHDKLNKALDKGSDWETEYTRLKRRFDQHLEANLSTEKILNKRIKELEKDTHELEKLREAD